MLKNKNYVPLIVWIVSYIFLLTTLVNNFSAAHDSINYLYHITRGEHLFHQHHLLYHFLANKWMLCWRFLGVPDHYLIESFTALWGAGVFTLSYLFFQNRFFLSRSACLAGTAAIAFSYGAWFYSTNIEVYMPPALLILWCLYVLTGEKKEIWKVSVLSSLAILFHQVNVLFAVVVLYCMWKHKFTYILICTVITGSVYFITGWFVEGHNNVNDWIHWMQGYTAGPDYWRPLSIKTPLYVLTGFARTFVGGHFLFQLPFAKEQAQQSFQKHGLQDEIFLSANISPAMAWVLLVLTIAFAAIFITMLVKLRHRKVRHYPILLCIATYSLFFCFWMPEILEFWILQMILVWIVLIGSLRGEKIIYAMPVLLFCINYFGSMRWLQNSKNDWYYIETRKLSETIKPGQTVTVDDWILEDYLRYFTRAKVITQRRQ